MKPSDRRELAERFRRQHALITASEARAAGMDKTAVARKVRAREWEVVFPGVLRLRGAPRTKEQDLMAACLAAGPTAIASHRSATWLWDLTDAPAHPAITVARGVSARIAGVDVHRPRTYPSRRLIRRGIPCADPLRALIDLASGAGADLLDDAIDRALASRLVSVEALEAELRRIGGHGRRGVGVLRQALGRRGLTGTPHPSVLESRLLRLLRSARIEPIGTEVQVGEDGRYRVDSMLTPSLAVEVDGYAYHHTPEQKAEDERRRRRLRMSGIEVLVYTWRDVVHDGGHVVAEIHATLARTASLAADGTLAGP